MPAARSRREPDRFRCRDKPIVRSLFHLLERLRCDDRCLQLLRSDYIIHALGEEWRARYESALAEGKHEYLTTIREDFTYWESWVRRMNWGTYVGILSRYHPIASTDYNILWRRSATVAQNLAAGTCEIIRQSPTSTLLKVTAPTDLRGPGYVDINVEYALSQGPWWRSPTQFIHTSPYRTAGRSTVGATVFRRDPELTRGDFR